MAAGFIAIFSTFMYIPIERDSPSGVGGRWWGEGLGPTGREGRDVATR